MQELEGEPAAPCLRAAAEAARQVTAEGWTSRPEWASCARGADAPAAEGELGLGNPGWQRHAVLALHTSFRERVLLPALAPAARALLHSQSGPHAGMWLAAIPSDAASTLAPDLMHVAMRRRLRLPLPLTALHCGAEGRHGCGAEVDAYGDHHLACPRTGLLPRRGFVVERAWVQVAREAVGPEGRVVPQPWLSRTTAPQVHPGDCRRLDFVVYGATSNGEALCCDATLVSPLTRAGRPVPGADAREGVALVAARRRKVARYPELTPRRASTTRRPRCRSRGPLERRVPAVPPYPTPASCPTRPTTLARRCRPGLGAAVVECAVGCPAASRRQLRARSLDHAAAAWCARRAPVR